VARSGNTGGSQQRRSPLKAVILVGGGGTRLQPLTNYMPKPMLPVLNRPFLGHTIAYLRECGVDNIILAVSYLAEVIRDYFGDGSSLGVNLTYTVETDPLGTAGAVKNAEPYLNDTFTVLNGDIFTELDIADMLAFHRRQGAVATIALTWVDNPCAFGVVETGSDGRVRRFIEKPSADRVTTNWINAGVYILEPEVLEHVPANSHYMFESGLFPLLLELGQPIYGYPFRGYWLDMGTPEKYLCLNCDLLLSKAKSALTGDLSRDGVNCDQDTTIHPSVKIVGPAVVGSKCRIDQKAYIKGPVVIGPDCCIGEGASIENTVLCEGVRVGSGARLKQCILGGNTSVEDNARIIKRVVISDRDSTAQIESLG